MGLAHCRNQWQDFFFNLPSTVYDIPVEILASSCRRLRVPRRWLAGPVFSNFSVWPFRSETCFVAETRILDRSGIILLGQALQPIGQSHLFTLKILHSRVRQPISSRAKVDQAVWYHSKLGIGRGLILYYKVAYGP